LFLNVYYMAPIALASLGMKDCILIFCFIQITEPASYVCFNFVVLGARQAVFRLYLEV
jgi:hypothetical protein